MSYVLTIWLIWAAPFDATLIQYSAPTCVDALTEIFDQVINDGVTDFQVVSCQLVQEA